ncbi:MAG: DUF1361 domain-containing protein [Anaerolineales bacterium]|nr:DUF1361 domain-containing protein [Anaerolineales bacterium]MCB9145842.1 DUF1361 domain-containing protein [Anaerolineales bacterium]
MIEQLRQFYGNQVKPFRFRLTIIGLLAGASFVSVILFQVRVKISGTLDFAFLIWNLFLAWLPLGMSYIASSFSRQRRYVALTLPLATILWLLFFPNAPYILTDLFHLRHQIKDVPLWYDTLLINWFAWTGVLLGVFSLFIMHDIVRRSFGRIAGWLFVLIVSALCGVGIYIGRFLRWNSWDVILHPFERMREMLYYASHPSMQSIIFISVFSALFAFIYITTYSFGLLFQEHAQSISQDNT